MMRLSHGDFEFDLEDEWWKAAGMKHWKPAGQAYRPNVADVLLVRIADIAPVPRNLSHGVFNNDAETGLYARDRVISILTGFRQQRALPPVEVQKAADGAMYPYRLTHGAHRFYLSIAAGFTHIPAVLAREW